MALAGADFHAGRGAGVSGVSAVVRFAAAWLVALLVAGSGGAWAQTAIRTGEHPGFGRVVFDLPAGAEVDSVTEGERLLLVFRGAGTLTAPASLARNVVSVQVGSNSATLVLAAGAQPRSVKMGNRLVIDVADPARRTAVPAVPMVVRPAPLRPAAAPLEAVVERGRVPAPEVAPDPPKTEAAAVPVVPVSQDALPPPAPAVAEPPPPPEVPAAVPPVLLRADADVGAAAFRRGGTAMVVLDRRVAVDAPPEGGRWVPGAVSMTLMLPVAPGERLDLVRVPAGWTVQRVTGPVLGTIQPLPAADLLNLAISRPGRVVSILDPVTGATLLVGTTLASAPEAGVPMRRGTPGYILLPSWLGVAVEPRSDRVDLRAVQGGFALIGGGALPDFKEVTQHRQFDFPDQAAPALMNRLHAQLAGAAAAAPRARTEQRTAAAQTMIALGMGAEAQALLQVIAADDPQAAADAHLAALAGVAATLAGRLGEADGQDDTRLGQLDASDELNLWRGLRDQRLGRETAASRGLADMMPLVKSYPATLRRLVWPAVAEAAAQAGQTLPADAPPFARAMQLDRAGKVDEAAAAYDAIVAGADRLDQVRAAVRAAELRLAAGRISPVEAAAVMERQSFAWRGDGREAEFRLRAAELRGTAGEWQPALEALRQIDAQFPEQHASVQARRAGVMQAMLAAEGGSMSPLDLVLLAAQNADGVPEGEQGGALARLLAEKLLALDLPARAIPVLQGLMKSAPAGPPRAEFGSRLAQLLFDGGDPAGAQTALDASNAADLPAGLLEARGLLTGRILAAKGDLAGAAATLAGLGTDSADDLRATLLATAGDWTGSLAALSDLAGRRVPRDGVLDDRAQEVLLREASTAARIPDPARLALLDRSAPRMTGPRADLFRVLTAPPLAAATDLPRAAQELRLARMVPQRVNALGGR